MTREEKQHIIDFVRGMLGDKNRGWPNVEQAVAAKFGQVSISTLRRWLKEP